MVLGRKVTNSLALFLGSSVASLAFNIGCTSLYLDGAIIGVVIGASLGGLICGIFIYKRDWKFIGPSNIILILVFAIITVRFAHSGGWWDVVLYHASIFFLVFGGIALLAAFGTLLGYLVKLGLKSYLRKREIIS